MQQSASNCSDKNESLSARIGAAAGQGELCIPLPLLGPGLALMISHGPSLEGPSIYAWLLSSDGREGADPLATFDALLSECCVEYDGFGADPLIRIGSSTFRIQKPYAVALEACFAFQLQAWHD